VGGQKVLKLSLVVMFVLSLATLSFASSLMPLDHPIPVAASETPLWVHTFE
jgi:hypothetical protein